MKLTKKQEEIKAKILAGTDIGDLRELSQEQKEVIYSHYLPHDDLKCEVWNFLGVCDDNEFDFWTKDSYNNGLPLINMSEWFEEEEWKETPSGFRTPTNDEIESIRTKDMREYDEKLIVDYNVLIVKYNLAENLTKARKQFLDQRYPTEALLKEKAEIEQRLKEIEEQLGGVG
jgi:hypothetical protein